MEVAQGGVQPPPPVREDPKKPTLNRVKDHSLFMPGKRKILTPTAHGAKNT